MRRRECVDDDRQGAVVAVVVVVAVRMKTVSLVAGVAMTLPSFGCGGSVQAEKVKERDGTDLFKRGGADWHGWPSVVTGMVAATDVRIRRCAT
jgi:hypothetical protein